MAEEVEISSPELEIFSFEPEDPQGKSKLNYVTKINGKTVQFLGKKSYTEDQIPIYSVLVSNFSAKKSILELDKDMSEFGEVLNIKRFKESKIPKAIITFRKAQSASKILIKNHGVHSGGMKVEPAFSWLQPKSINAKGLENDKKEEYYFEYLPNDCLYYMFNFMTFSDHVKLSQMSKKLMDTFKLFYKTKKCCKLNKNTITGLTLMQIRQALIDIGYKIENLKLSKTENDNVLFEFILKYCPKLKFLQLCGINFKSRNMRKEVSTKLKYLKELKIKNCKENIIHTTTNLDDRHILQNVYVRVLQ